jgi:hemerythrin-like domain-containing protein
MVHCHEKIEWYLEALMRAGESLRRGVETERKAAFADTDMARAHLAGPGVKHTADEEESLFPRMRERGGIAARETLAAADELEAQHQKAQSIEREFNSLVENLPRDGSADMHDIERFNELAVELNKLYRPHIQVENGLVFPAAARILTAEELRQIGVEMRARRQTILQRNGLWERTATP